MKYKTGNEPIQCYLTKSACYKGTKPMTVRGVLWHSTGANNPNLCRYVQPADDDPNRDSLLALLGTNKYSNDYNHGAAYRQMGMNAWIGKLADGSVTTIQTMPFGWRPWGCGSDTLGSCNVGWIQFEICEDGLTDPEYAAAVYREACELTAFLCSMYHLDPHGTVSFKGVNVPVILDHRMSHTLKLGNNHGDVQHWFPNIIGKTLEDIRDDVAALMAGSGVDVIPALQKGSKGDNVKDMQNKLLALGYDLGKWGADGAFGSATESAVKEFQINHGLTATGVADAATLEALTASLGATYTVVIHGVGKAEAEAMKTRWPDCEVNEE